jgi:hypothetical protein
MNSFTPGQPQSMLSKDHNGFETGGHISLDVNSAGYLSSRLQSSDFSYTLTDNANVLVPGQWYFAAVRFGPGGFHLYLNGNEVGTPDPEGDNLYQGGLGKRIRWYWQL